MRIGFVPYKSKQVRRTHHGCMEDNWLVAGDNVRLVTVLVTAVTNRLHGWLERGGLMHDCALERLLSVGCRGRGS